MCKITESFEVDSLMAQVELSPQARQANINRIKAQWYSDRAEEYAKIICKKHFGKVFKLANTTTQKGFDIISEDGELIIEVKQTSRPHSDKVVNLQIGSTWGKKNICTHILIMDLYNNPIKVSIIPHDKFFNSKFYGKVKMWRWDIDYGTRIKENTKLFIDNLIKL
jgi:hypothetical protein